MRPRLSAAPALCRPLGALFISLIALAGCRDIDSPERARAARSALADKSGIPDTLPFHVDEKLRAAPGATPFVCGPGLSVPSRLIGEGTIAPHMGRTQSRLFVMDCQIGDGVTRLTMADTVAGATGDSLFLGWIVSIFDVHNGNAELRIEMFGLGGSGWFYKTTGSAMAVGSMNLESGSGSYRGSGTIGPHPGGSAQAPLLIPETISASEERFTCGLSRSGAAYCWGQNDHGQLGDGTKTDRLVPTPVSGGHTFREISTGSYHACGLTTTGSVYCWGMNSQGQLGNTDKTDHTQPTLVAGSLVFFQISAGFNHTCGRTTSGVAYCWGDNTSGALGEGTLTERDVPTAVLGGLTFDQVMTGETHTCALTDAGAAYCWGANAYGELGDSTTISRRTPRLVLGGWNFTRITVGNRHTCALDSNSSAYCWGDNANGQLGNGQAANRNTPSPVNGGAHYRRISSGWGHTCAVELITQVASCWGSNDYGQLGDGTTQWRRNPAPISGTRVFAQISAGRYHSCAVTTSGVAYCWGNNLRGEVGDGSNSAHYIPAQVSSVLGDGQTLTKISAGNSHTCGLTAAGDAYCWGENAFGALGDGSATERDTPVAVTGDNHFDDLSAGANHTCATRTDGQARCWGLNLHGQLGDGTTTNHMEPTPVASAPSFAMIRAGSSHTCAIASGGVVYCWGSNEFGQLGDGTTTDRHSPTLISGPYAFWRIAAGHTNNCALTLDGAVYCWGSYGGISPSNTPVLVPAPEPLVWLEAGDRTTCGITWNSDKVYCWGINANGQLGDGTTNTVYTPERLVTADPEGPAPIPLTHFGIGASHVCVTALYGGAAYCSGWNYYGQLGDNSTTERHVQTRVYGTLAFEWIAGGGDHTCALSSGAAYCWGRNSNGQLGTDDTSDRHVPAMVTRLFFKIQ